MEGWQPYSPGAKDPYAPLGNVPYPVSEEAAPPDDQQLHPLEDLILRTFDPQPDLNMPISTPYLETTTSHATVCQPVLTITEQPARETRYRYKSESGSHGPLIGESSTPQRKTYPAVKLDNYDPKLPYRVKASLFTHDSNPQPHVHKITMKGHDEEDCCCVTVREGKAVFPSMSIVFQQKKTVAETLYRRKMQEFGGTEVSDAKRKQLQNDAKKEASEMNLNLVRICFTAERCDEGIWHPVCHVLSNPIANSKAGKLKITKVNRTSGSCVGNDEVWILCEKVNKKDIQIRFFDMDESWQANATFSESDVHYQVAIVFRTPCYRDTNIQEDVRVKFQLRRISDGETSDAIDFTYKPRSLTEQETLMHKRRKLCSQNSQSSAMDPSTPGSSSFVPSGQGEPYMEQPYDQTSDPPELSEEEILHSEDNFCEKWLEWGCGEPLMTRAMKDKWSNPMLPQGCYEADSAALESSMRNLSLNDECRANKEALYCLLKWLLTCMVQMTTASGLVELLDFLMLFGNKNQQNMFHILAEHHKHIAEPVKNALSAVDHQFDLRRYVSTKDADGNAPLHLAVLHDNVDMLSLLINSGADITATDKMGDTTLHIACKSPDRMKSLVCLVNHLNTRNSNTNRFNNDGMTALHVAIVNDNVPAVQELCKHGTDVNVAVWANGDTPLHLAARQNSAKAMAILLHQESLDADKVNNDGDTAMSIARDFALTDLVELLSKGRNCSRVADVEPGDVPGKPDSSSHKPSESRGTEERQDTSVGAVREEDNTRKSDETSPELQSRVVDMLNCTENARKMLTLFLDPSEIDGILRIFQSPCLGAALFEKYLKGRSDDEIQSLLQLTDIA
ncbi:nuclear factor NF-kappa-B p110 subunit-like isoform X2 [Ornithodoros turicata]|uniref:nuclear factor NF-kappa-B p110 subunit-like isoform X2 n=1 Tax=Ornithodoros turicata TaxID=34597 RepID=UPI00313960B6